MIELVPLCTFTGTLGAPLTLDTTPSGTRLIFEVLDGSASGDRLNATLKGQANADWLTIGADGTGTLDVRLLLETHDGALVFIQYQGRVDTTVPGSPVYATPRFDSGDVRYLWLNKIQAVARGTLDGNTLTYEVCEVR